MTGFSTLQDPTKSLVYELVRSALLGSNSPGLHYKEGLTQRPHSQPRILREEFSPFFLFLRFKIQEILPHSNLKDNSSLRINQSFKHGIRYVSPCPIDLVVGLGLMQFDQQEPPQEEVVEVDSVEIEVGEEVPEILLFLHSFMFLMRSILQGRGGARGGTI